MHFRQDPIRTARNDISNKEVTNIRTHNTTQMILFLQCRFPQLDYKTDTTDTEMTENTKTN